LDETPLSCGFNTLLKQTTTITPILKTTPHTTTIKHSLTRITTRTTWSTTTTTILQTKMFSIYILVGLCPWGWIVTLSLMPVNATTTAAKS